MHKQCTVFDGAADDADGIDDVLDAHRDSGEESTGPAFVHGARLGERCIGVEVCPRLHVAFALRDAFDVRADDFFGRNRAVADLPDDFGCATAMKRVHAIDSEWCV